MSALFITGGRVVDPRSALDAVRDLRVRNGAIAELGEHLLPADDETVIDARGTVVAPGFIDMHVHLREPGYAYKETIETGTEAALRGGFSSVACMPNTQPALDEPGVLQKLRAELARRARCRVYPIAAITRGRKGAQPCEFTALAQAGAVAFSDDGDTVENPSVLREAALLALDLAPPFISHCLPEELIVRRDLQIAVGTNKRWHIAHVSAAPSLDLIRMARAQGAHVTCEVTPHHLTFTEGIAEELGPAATVNPPLRTEADVQALRNGARDGTIDVLASDHAPHAAHEKNASDGSAAPGFSGLEVAVGAYAAALEDLPISRFVELLSSNPARILGVPGGTLTRGSPADITIFADRAWTVDPASFASLGKCTPFSGKRLPRKVMATIVGGDICFRAEDFQA
jgi:dihydroorotase